MKFSGQFFRLTSLYIILVIFRNRHLFLGKMEKKCYAVMYVVIGRTDQYTQEVKPVALLGLLACRAVGQRARPMS